MNRMVICVCNVATIAQSVGYSGLWCSASVVTGVVFHFLCHFDLLLLVVEDAATSRTSCACNIAVLTLSALRHHFARTAWPAHSVGGDFIAKWRGLERLVVVQAIAPTLAD